MLREAEPIDRKYASSESAAAMPTLGVPGDRTSSHLAVGIELITCSFASLACASIAKKSMTPNSARFAVRSHSRLSAAGFLPRNAGPGHDQRSVTITPKPTDSCSQPIAPSQRECGG